MKIVLIYFIRLYQILISPVLPPSCRFYPTCSEYFIQALQEKNFFTALYLGLYRILRCNPFSEGGFDPLPDHKECCGKNNKLKIDHYNG